MAAKPPDQPVRGNPFIKKRISTAQSLQRDQNRWSNHFGSTTVAKFSGDRDEKCGNCGLKTHHFANCIGPLNINGCLAGCPIHGTRSHSYDKCFHPLAHTPESMQLYLINHRIGLPPLDSSLYGEYELDRSKGCPLDPGEVLKDLTGFSNWHQHQYPLRNAKFSDIKQSSGGDPNWHLYQYPLADLRPAQQTPPNSSSYPAQQSWGGSLASRMTTPDGRPYLKASPSQNPSFGTSRPGFTAPLQDPGFAGFMNPGPGFNASSPQDPGFTGFMNPGPGLNDSPPQDPGFAGFVNPGPGLNDSARGVQSNDYNIAGNQNTTFNPLLGDPRIVRSNGAEQTKMILDGYIQLSIQLIQEEKSKQLAYSQQQQQQQLQQRQAADFNPSLDRSNFPTFPQYDSSHTGQDSRFHKLPQYNATPEELDQTQERANRVKMEMLHQKLNFIQQEPPMERMDLGRPYSPPPMAENISDSDWFSADIDRQISEQMAEDSESHGSKLVAKFQFERLLDFGMQYNQKEQLKNQFFQKPPVDFVKCMHCLKSGHEGVRCPDNCHICGDKHPGIRCLKACSCTYYSDHPKWFCEAPCLLCKPGDPQFGTPHKAMQCPTYCAICGSTDQQVQLGADFHGCSSRCNRHYHWCTGYHLAGYPCMGCFVKDCDATEIHNHCPHCGAHDHNVYECPHSIYRAEDTDANQLRLLTCGWCKVVFPFGNHECIENGSSTQGRNVRRKISSNRHISSGSEPTQVGKGKTSRKGPAQTDSLFVMPNTHPIKRSTKSGNRGRNN